MRDSEYIRPKEAYYTAKAVRSRELTRVRGAADDLDYILKMHSTAMPSRLRELMRTTAGALRTYCDEQSLKKGDTL